MLKARSYIVSGTGHSKKSKIKQKGFKDPYFSTFSDFLKLCTGDQSTNLQPQLHKLSLPPAKPGPPWF